MPSLRELVDLIKRLGLETDEVFVPPSAYDDIAAFAEEASEDEEDEAEEPDED